MKIILRKNWSEASMEDKFCLFGSLVWYLRVICIFVVSGGEIQKISQYHKQKIISQQLYGFLRHDHRLWYAIITPYLYYIVKIYYNFSTQLLRHPLLDSFSVGAVRWLEIIHRLFLWFHHCHVFFLCSYSWVWILGKGTKQYNTVQ